jgi:hypothetical protein
MTTRRVHIYCISIIALLLIGGIIDVYIQVVLNIHTLIIPQVLSIVAAGMEIIVTPITSIWVCVCVYHFTTTIHSQVIVTLLLHLRVLNDLNDRKGMIEMILVSCALLIQVSGSC